MIVQIGLIQLQRIQTKSLKKGKVNGAGKTAPNPKKGKTSNGKQGF